MKRSRSVSLSLFIISMTLFSFCSKKDKSAPEETKTGVTVQFDGKTWVYEKASAFAGNDFFAVEWELMENGTNLYGSVSWVEPGTGKREWNMDNQFYWYPEGYNAELSYHSYWKGGDDAEWSTGSVEITKWGNVGEVVEGTFTIPNSGGYQGTSATYIGTKEIKGSFRVIRK